MSTTASGIDDLTTQVGRISMVDDALQSQSQSTPQHNDDDDDETDATEAAEGKEFKTPVVAKVSTQGNNHVEEPHSSMTFWGDSADVEKFIPMESYVLWHNRHDYETEKQDQGQNKNTVDSFTSFFHKTDNQNLQTKAESDVVTANNEASLSILASWIRTARHILVISGAGISVSAGIPDFRTKGTGLVRFLKILTAFV
jgi:hypothetical protein